MLFRLLHRHALCKIAGLIDVDAAIHAHEIAQKLQRDDGKGSRKDVHDLRNIQNDLGDLLRTAVPVVRDGDEIAFAALDFRHIRDRLFLQPALRQNADDESPLLYEADGAVLELARRVRLRVDIADLFEFEAPLHADGVIDAAAHEKDVVFRRDLRCKLLDRALVLKDALDLFGERLKRRDIALFHFRGQKPLALGERDRKDIARDELRGVGLGGGDGDLRPRLRIEHAVCLPCNGRAHHVDDGRRHDLLLFGKAERCQRIRRLPRLADRNDERIGRQDGIAVTELGGELHAAGDAGDLLRHILRHEPCMIGRAARHDDDLRDALQILFRKPVDVELRLPFAGEGIERIFDDARLFADLLHHEVLVAALLGALRIPIDVYLFLFDDIAVEVVEGDFARSETRHLQVIDIVDVPRVFEHGRHVGGKIGIPLRNADDHRTVLAGNVDLLGIVLEENGERIRSPHAHHGLCERVDGSHPIFLIVIIHELDEHFGVRLGIEGIAVTQELFLDLAVVFDDAVVYAHDAAVIAAVRMGVVLRRVAVRRPARMADPAAAADLDGSQLLL